MFRLLDFLRRCLSEKGARATQPLENNYRYHDYDYVYYYDYDYDY